MRRHIAGNRLDTHVVAHDVDTAPIGYDLFAQRLTGGAIRRIRLDKADLASQTLAFRRESLAGNHIDINTRHTRAFAGKGPRYPRTNALGPARHNHRLIRKFTHESPSF